MNVWRSVKRVALLTALVAAGGLSAQAAEPIKLRLSWTPVAPDIMLYWGKEQGWFAAEGLDLVLEDGNGSANTVNLLGAGNYDLGYANCGTMAIARDKAGMPLKCISNVVRQPTIGLWVPKDSGIKTLKDAEAKGNFRMTFTQGSFEGPFMNAFFKAGGVDPNKFKLVNTDFQTKMTLYMAGEADGAVSAIPQWLRTLDEKRPSNYIAFGDLGLLIPDFGIIARDDQIEKNDPKVAKFMKVFTRGWTFFLDNPGKADEGIALMIKSRPDSKLDAANVKSQWDSYSKFFFTKATEKSGKAPGWQAPEDWQRTIELMIEAGLVKPGAKPTDFYTNKYLEGTS